VHAARRRDRRAFVLIVYVGGGLRGVFLFP
jgi:hypothetical protein